eukprot:scaffold67146_cov30-Tisochrysis_lutea.AAC.8
MNWDLESWASIRKCWKSGLGNWWSWPTLAQELLEQPTARLRRDEDNRFVRAMRTRRRRQAARVLRELQRWKKASYRDTNRLAHRVAVQACRRTAAAPTNGGAADGDFETRKS